MFSHPCNYVETIVVIVERIAPTAFKATLPNGKQTVAFVEKKNAHLRDVLRPGDRAQVTICPADFERARIDAIVE